MGGVLQVFLAAFLIVIFIVPWDKANNDVSDAAQLSQIKENIEIIEAAKDSSDPVIKEEAIVAKENLVQLQKEREARKELEKQSEIAKKELVISARESESENEITNLVLTVIMVLVSLLAVAITLGFIKRRRQE